MIMNRFADTKTGITWAGQSFTNGTASGTEVVEALQDGKVTVKGSEGVLVFFFLEYLCPIRIVPWREIARLNT